jgi:myosin-crossreactive antigen
VVGGGFAAWHSAAKLRRHLLRFLRLFPDLEPMQIIQSTRHCGHDSIERSMVRWLEAQGVRFESGVQVTDLQFEPSDSGKAVRRIEALRHGEPFGIDVGPRDLVIVTLGSMPADSSFGSMQVAPRHGTSRGAAPGCSGNASRRRIRRSADRPPVIPAGTSRLAVVGQYCEIPHDVVYTVEYSVHSARLAVRALLGLSEELPPTYQGLDHPNALVEALRRILH